MDQETRARLAKELSLDSPQEDVQEQLVDLPYISYGTAGFRGNAASIKHLFYKLGIAASLKCLKEGFNVGVMITASHNPIQDNGVKLVDPNGELLEIEWEQVVEKLCNIHEKDQFLDEIDSICSKYEIDTSKGGGNILIAMDTRPSSDALVALVKQGIDLWSPLVNYVDFGQVTTPILHYLVAESNLRPVIPISPQNYYDLLIEGLYDIFSQDPASSELYRNDLVIDCANGVGSETMNNLCLNSRFNECLQIQLINTGDGILNKSCGADFVKSTHGIPTGAGDITMRYASLDGDADRVIYFYLEPDADGLRLKLLDGDKILALYALFIQDTLKAASFDGVSMGVIQTAYANGASTEYVRDTLGIENIECVDTGVKNLHAKAKEFDVGIYFEANGHGSILLSDRIKSLMEESADEIGHLKRVLSVMNSYTGDAISDILVVESILRYYDWDIKKWDELYTDRASALIKVSIADKSQVATTDAGKICTSPLGLQEEIDKIISNYGPKSRSFVRPSGTEDCVRIYAEAEDQETADKLAAEVAKVLETFCNNRFVKD